jgi:hypothetical protein
MRNSSIVQAMTYSALLLSCSGGGGESATAGESDSATTTTATATEATQGGTMTESGTTQGGTASMSDSDATTASSASESDPTTTGPGSATDTDTTAATEADTDTDTDTGTDTDTDTDTDSDTSGPNFCGQDPPLGFVGDFNAECKNEPKIGTFSPVLEWNKSAWSVAPSSAQIMVQPVVGPLTDDDKDGVYGSAGDMPAIVVVSFTGTAWTGAGVLRAVTGEGTELFSVSDQSLGGASGLAIGNIDDDPAPEIIAVTTNAAIKAFEHDGSLKWTSATYPGDLGAYPAGAAPSIADMDGDGKPEIIVGRVILNNNGTFRAKGAFGVGQGIYAAASVAADVDGDGTIEVVVGNALYRPNGAAIWSLNLADGFPAVADFTGDGKAEIVVVTNGGVRLQSAEGAVLWTKVNPAGVGGPPTIADFDGDGEPEIGIAGKTAYIVFDTDGEVLWQKPTKDDSSSATGSAVYDFEGDGVADIVYADETSLWVFSGIDGAVKLKAPHNSGTLIETPVIVDVDNDGEVEIVVTHNNAFFGGPLLGISVIGDQNKSWRPGRKIWNQHGYSITKTIHLS